MDSRAISSSASQRLNLIAATGGPVPDLFEQLKQKYQPVLDTIQKEGAQLENVNLDGNQLYLKATATSEASKNRIWDAIKRVDPNFADLKHDIEFRQTDQTSRCSVAIIYRRSASSFTAIPINIRRSRRRTSWRTPIRSRPVSN